MVIRSEILQHLVIRTVANSVNSNGGTNSLTNLSVPALQQDHPSTFNEVFLFPFPFVQGLMMKDNEKMSIINNPNIINEPCRSEALGVCN
jgi:hypothetical protein